MFCPTAVDEFFIQKLSNIDINLYKRNLNESKYQDRVSFEERVKDAQHTKIRYPTKIPLVIERHKTERNLEEIDKIKWLVPREMTLAQLSAVIKQRINCPAGHQLFLALEHRDLPPLLASLASLHSDYKNSDGFLYLSYSSQEISSESLMAPLENKKPPRLSVKSQSIDGCGQSVHFGVTKRPSPEYLVRTGSLKNKVIPPSTSALKPPSNYAVYNIQTGCFTWQGRSDQEQGFSPFILMFSRAYYKNSYMIQRNDGRSRRSFMEQNNKKVDYLPTKNYPKQIIKEKFTNTNSEDSEHDKCWSKDSSGHQTRYLGNESTCQNNHLFVGGEKEKNNVEDKPSEVLNDDIQIPTSTVKLAENKLLKKSLNTSKSHLDLTRYLKDNLDDSGSLKSCKKEVENTSLASQDKHSNIEKQSLRKTEEKSLSDDKQTRSRLSNDLKAGDVADPHQSYFKHFDDQIMYENWSPRMPSLENICQKYQDKVEKFDPLNYDHQRDQLLLVKMREKMKFLIDQQFNIDYKIVLNDIRGKDIENKLGMFASERELEKFRIYVEEFDSVNCLIRGLAGRLAMVEDNLDQLNISGEKLDNRYVMASRKKDKLELQLSEALWIKNKIERRSVKIERSLLKHLGQAELEDFNDFLVEKEQLISCSAELNDKIKLCKKQIMELELGHQILDM